MFGLNRKGSFFVNDTALVIAAIAPALSIAILSASPAHAQQKHSIWMALPPPDAKDTTPAKTPATPPQKTGIFGHKTAPAATIKVLPARAATQPGAAPTPAGGATATGSSTQPGTLAQPQVFALPPSSTANNTTFPGYQTANETPLVNSVCPGVNPRKIIVERLQEMGISPTGEAFKNAHLDIIDCPELQKLFPKRLFYSFRTPYGAPKPPEPLTKKTIILVDDAGNVMPMTDWTELQRMFIAQGIKVSDEKIAAETTKAWMALHQQLVRSDAFAFEASAEPTITKAENGSISAQGQLDAEYEGKKVGHLKVFLQFDQSGRLSMVNEDSTLPPG